MIKINQDAGGTCYSCMSKENLMSFNVGNMQFTVCKNCKKELIGVLSESNLNTPVQTEIIKISEDNQPSSTELKNEPIKTKRHSAADVISNTFYMDYAEMKDSKYKPGQTDKPVYVVGDDYYCAGKIGTKPAKSTRNGQIEFDWVEYKSWYADQIGWQVWEHKCK